MSLLEHLNQQQQKAACTIDGPVLTIAGAGSGKTMALTYRIAYMLQDCDISPKSIMAVTFTNKAAGEMKQRIAKLTDGSHDGLWAGTFHATCARILRTDGDAINIPSNFVIFDEDDQRSLIKQALAEADIDSKDNPPRDVQFAINNAKNELLTPSEYRRNSKGQFEDRVRRVYARYQRLLRDNNALDFDDLLMRTVQLFNDVPDVRENYQNRFTHILVDEFQDINYAQFEFVRILADKHRNICVVGDDDQSIYSWRGADVNLMLRFEDYYPNATTIKLEENYRSTQKILECAYEVIKENSDRRDKKLWTRNRPGNNLVQYEAVDATQEAEWIAQSIRTQVNCDVADYGDFAILYRTNALSRNFEEALMKFSIPYEVVGGLRFYERAVIKDIIAYLRVIANPDDSLSLSRIINKPSRGIGDKTVGALQRFARKQDVSLYEAVQLTARSEDDTLKTRAHRCVREFAATMEALRDKAEQEPISKLCLSIMRDTGYLQKLEESGTAEDDTKVENIEQFITGAQEFEQKQKEDVTLTDFLEHIALVADIDEADQLESKVSLMTLHSAKGLEFPVVYIVAMEEGMFPHRRSMNNEFKMAEERRLCYVGMTRAEDMLYLTHAHRRTVYGTEEEQRPSRFLRDLPDEFVDRDITVSNLLNSGSGDEAETDEKQKDGRDINLTEMLSRAERNSRIAAERNGQDAQSDDNRGRSVTGPKVKSETDKACQKSPEAAGSSPLPAEESKHADPGEFDYNTGDHIRHEKFGEGLIVGVTGHNEKMHIAVAFADKGVKKLLPDIAPIEKIER